MTFSGVNYDNLSNVIKIFERSTDMVCDGL